MATSRPSTARGRGKKTVRTTYVEVRQKTALSLIAPVAVLAVGLGVLGIGGVLAISAAIPATLTCDQAGSEMLSDAVAGLNAEGRSADLNDVGRGMTAELRAFRKSSILTRGQRASRLKERLESRKQLLRELIALQPGAAERHLLRPALRDEMSAGTKNCFEQPTTKVGTFYQVHGDNPSAVEDEYEVTVLSSEGTDYEVFSPQVGQLEDIPNGAHVGLQALSIDTTLYVPPPQGGGEVSVNSFASPPASAESATLTERKLLVISADYSNTNDRSPSAAEMSNLLGIVDRYYLENSYGKFHWVTQSVDWLELPLARTSSPTQCDNFALVSQAIAAADPQVDFSQYRNQDIAFLAPFPDGCRWGGMAWLPGSTYSTAEGSVYFKGVVFVKSQATSLTDLHYVLSHELGHALVGGGHGNWYKCPTGESFYSPTCDLFDTVDSRIRIYGPIEYEDPYDVMGGWNQTAYLAYGGHYSSTRKYLANWLDQGQVATVRENDPPTQTFDLEPVERTGTGLKLVRVQRTGGGFMTIEFRQPLQADGVTPTEDNVFLTSTAPLPDVFEGALIRTYDSGNFPSAIYLIDASPAGSNSALTATLKVGQTLTDPASAATVRVISKTNDLLRIEVTPPVQIDRWAPDGPTPVYDGTTLGVDEDVTTSTTTLSATWEPASDIGSGVAGYTYQLIDELGTAILPWTPNGLSTTVTKTGLSLTLGKTYSFMVRAIDGAGQIGGYYYTDGITVVTTPPTPADPLPTGPAPLPPEILYDGLDYYDDLDFTNSTSILTANWSDPPDPDTFGRFQYAIGTTPGGQEVVAYTDVGANFSFFHHGLSLSHNSQYFVSIRVVGLDGIAGPPITSDGILVDTMAPAAPTDVLDGLTAPDVDVQASTLKLSANWTPSSDALYYYYAIGTTPGGTEHIGFSNLAFGSTTTNTSGGLRDGVTYYVSVRAVDAAGNVSSANGSDGIVINTSLDTQDPTITITEPLDGVTTSGYLHVVATASDDIGVRGVQFQVDGVDLWTEDSDLPFETWVDSSKYVDGPHVISAEVRDGVGKVATDTMTVTFDQSAPILDTQAPSVSWFFPAEGATVSGTSVQFFTMAIDNIDVTGFQFQVDGANIGPLDTSGAFSYQRSWDSTTVSNGIHVLSGVANDAAGNIGISTRTITVNNVPPDTTPPTVTLTSPLAPTIRGVVSVSAEASDDVGVTGVVFTVDGAATLGSDTASPFGMPWNTASYPDGSHSIEATASDAAGNSAADSYLLAIDNTAPAVSLTAPTESSTVSVGTTITAAATDNLQLAGVQFRIDGLNFGAIDMAAPYSIVWNTRLTTNGIHTLSAVATDQAGNSTTSATVTVTVFNLVSGDTTPPTVTITSPLSGATVSGTIPITASAFDNIAVTGVTFVWNGVTLGTVSSTPYRYVWNTETVPNSSGTLTVIARDGATNTTSKDVTITVRNDRIPPSLTCNFPVDGSTVRGIVSITASALDDVGVPTISFLWNGGAIVAPKVVTGIYHWDTTVVPNGSGVLRVIATDSANRTDEKSIRLTIANTSEPTLVPPSFEITFITPVNGETVAGSNIQLEAAVVGTGVQSVEFFRDDHVLIGTDLEAPYSAIWDSTLVSDGNHTLTAMVTSSLGRTDSESVRVVVDNQVPIVPLAASLSIATIDGSVTGENVQLGVASTRSLQSVTYYLDGVTPIGTSTVAPFSIGWDSRRVRNGVHALSLVAKDTAGQEVTSATVRVVVRNRLSIQVSAPRVRAIVKGRTLIVPTILGGSAMKQVTYTIQRGNKQLAIQKKPPFAYLWNTKKFRNGTYVVLLRAVDQAGAVATARITLRVRN